MIDFLTIFKEFMIGGTFVAVISGLGNYVDPLLAGLIAGIPIGLPSTIFINGKLKSKEYVTNLTITSALLLAVTLLFYYIYIKKDIEKKKSIAIAMGIWIIIVFILWRTRLTDKIPFLKTTM